MDANWGWLQREVAFVSFICRCAQLCIAFIKSNVTVGKEDKQDSRLACRKIGQRKAGWEYIELVGV